MGNFNIGDCVYHRSNPTIAWIIERIENNMAFCSTIIRGSNEHIEDAFELTTLEKCAEKGIVAGGKRRDTHY